MSSSESGTASPTALPMDGRTGPARLRSLPTRLLSLAATHSDRLVNEGLAAADARKWHYAVLATLEESGPASQAELSRRTGIYRSDLVAVINELTERGLVERAPDPGDRRRNVITVTERGRARFARLDELLTELEDVVLAPLSRPERDQLAGLLARLVDHHGRRDG
ncbi:MarR family winged helix-turn-helix transcriptional regulator [Microbispora triticiradicis]|uniref:MarR family winged helix-turn-helix transcriptional regulator n=1 Tax=Microbispora triticiradicis TaxID=2200763 RepID=UPI001FCC18B6|nr:MarR family transcriptional regulator [Microbispora triticiradicis]MBO4270340.1 MarR family transcriptional regulator [Microbispora triticiradicis]